MDTVIKGLAEFAGDGETLVIGLTGSVASGKSTLAGKLAEGLRAHGHVETVSTDGFLHPNAYLSERGLLLRKGFPETYDFESMARAVADIRSGSATFPHYSHDVFDIVPDKARTVISPDILLLEGLGFRAPDVPRGRDEPDLLIYLDASEADLVFWYVERFVRLWRAAADDPTSFYAQWLHMSEEELRAFAVQVWQNINLPNLHEHILPIRGHADVVLLKDRDHNVTLAEDRLSLF